MIVVVSKLLANAKRVDNFGHVTERIVRIPADRTYFVRSRCNPGLLVVGCYLLSTERADFADDLAGRQILESVRAAIAVGYVCCHGTVDVTQTLLIIAIDSRASDTAAVAVVGISEDSAIPKHF